jgi:hypothetical protein
MNIPNASVPVIENSTMSCVKLRGPRKALSCSAKKTTTPANAKGMAKLRRRDGLDMEVTLSVSGRTAHGGR